MNTLPSFEELKRQRRPIRDVNSEARARLTRLEKLAVWITSHVGTMGFFIIIFLWTISWLGWNTLAPAVWRFDPFPAFVMWLFISNMVQICLMPLIMVGQNLQNRHAEARAEVDYEVNAKSEREIEAILLRLEEHTRLLQELIGKLEKPRRSR